jgi:diacylglycerol kinase (ATP)
MNEPFSLKKRLKSFCYASKGILLVVRNEHNAWIHCSFIVGVSIAGYLFSLSRIEWIVVVACFGTVLAMETVNTACEKIVNFISPDYHKQAGEIKDIAAGAVLITALTTAIIGLLIFVPKIVGLFSI